MVQLYLSQLRTVCSLAKCVKTTFSGGAVSLGCSKPVFRYRKSRFSTTITHEVEYDTHKLHKALVASGFTDVQAEVINEQLKEVVNDSADKYGTTLDKLNNSVAELNKKVSRIEQLEKEVSLLEKGTVHVLRTENQKLATEINSFHAILKEDLQKIRNDLQLDFNLHKSWTKSALTELDKEVSRLSNQIEIKATDLGAQLDRSKIESLKYQITLVFSALTVLMSIIFAFYRFSSMVK